MCAFLNGFLKLSSRHQAEDVCAVIKYRNVFCPANFSNFLHRFRKREKAFAKYDHIGGSLFHQIGAFWCVKMIFALSSSRPEMQLNEIFVFRGEYFSPNLTPCSYQANWIVTDMSADIDGIDKNCIAAAQNSQSYYCISRISANRTNIGMQAF